MCAQALAGLARDDGAFGGQFGEALLRHLAEIGERQIIEDEQALGKLDLRHLLGFEKADQLVEGERAAGLRHDAGAHALAELGIGHRHAGDVLHRVVREDEVLDLLGADLLAAAIDEILLAALDHVVAGRMLAHQIAGAVEAIAA